MLRRESLGTAMLTKYLNGEYDLANSYVIGDRPTDVELAKNLGTQAIYIRNANFPLTENGENVFSVDGWDEIYEILRVPQRRVSHIRKTKETDITIDLNLDGSGVADISTGISFFDHMLDQLARHGGLDLTIKANGDLHIDEHHTIEDVAITLGEAFSLALADKRGMERYGFCLPMDDCLAQVAIDFGGRNWIVWDAEFKREMIGEMPTEMFFHFFKSFSDKALCNLNIKAEGTIEHHKIEAIFKAFAKAIKMAVRREGNASADDKGSFVKAGDSKITTRATPFPSSTLSIGSALRVLSPDSPEELRLGGPCHLPRRRRGFDGDGVSAGTRA